MLALVPRGLPQGKHTATSFIRPTTWLTYVHRRNGSKCPALVPCVGAVLRGPASRVPRRLHAPPVRVVLQGQAGPCMGPERLSQRTTMRTKMRVTFRPHPISHPSRDGRSNARPNARLSARHRAPPAQGIARRGATAEPNLHVFFRIDIELSSLDHSPL